MTESAFYILVHSGQVTDINNSKGVVHYDYNANGLRKGKTVDGKTTGFVWNGQNMAAETSNGNISNVYTYDMTGILSVKDGGNNLSTYMKNAHGDVTGIVDKNDKLTKSYQYDAFGNEIGINDADTNPFRYYGEYYDNETGDIYLRARYYSSGTGRFISEDPVKDGTNWYSYCAGNPVAFIDPSGLAIKLEGTQEEIDKMLEYLRELTNDGICMDPDRPGYVVIYEHHDGDQKAGTSLVRRLISNRYDCTIKVTSKDTGAEPVNYKNASTPGRGSGGVIHLNLYDPIFALEVTGSETVSRKAEMPKYIELGHELIHVLRYMGGNRNADNYGIHAYYDEYQNLQSETVKMEELATTGISYQRPDGSYADAGNWAMSENVLRDEHGLNRRVKYSK